MKFAVKKHRIAENDLVAAAAWYDEKLPGLGNDFLDEADAAVNSLSDNALLHSVRFDDVRCIRLRRFKKYGVYYVVRGEEIWVLAICHGARHPSWLRERRKQVD